MLFRVEEPPQPELGVVAAAIVTAMWLLPALVGSGLVLIGAPLYWRARPAPLLVGWVLIAMAWYQYYSPMNVALTDVLRWVSALLGVLLALAVFALCVRTAERMTPQEPETEGLTEKERKYVESVLRRHLEVTDDP